MQDIDKVIQHLLAYFFKKEGSSADADIEDALSPNKKRADRLIQQLEEDGELERSLHEYAALKQEAQARKAKVFKHIQKRIAHKPKPFIRFSTKIYYSAVAVVLFALSTVLYLKSRTLPPQEEMQELSFQQAEEIIPGKAQPRITLDDGRVLDLDIQAGGIVVNNGLTYAGGKPVLALENQLMNNRYMTLSIPRGSAYRVTLPDHSVVFMNAESELRYPLQFAQEKREVYLKGEAFFDVTKDAAHPFVVHAPRGIIEVLGTSFNVKSYEEEAQQFVTLATGAVKITGQKQAVFYLKPGQQSVLSDSKSYVQEVNVDDFTGWKDGRFNFNDEGLESAMVKLGRWYDLDIRVLPSAKGLKLWGSLGRHESFDKVLHILKIIDKDLKVKIHNSRVEIMKEG